MSILSKSHGRPLPPPLLVAGPIKKKLFLQLPVYHGRTQVVKKSNFVNLNKCLKHIQITDFTLRTYLWVTIL